MLMLTFSSLRFSLCHCLALAADPAALKLKFLMQTGNEVAALALCINLSLLSGGCLKKKEQAEAKNRSETERGHGELN